MSLIITTDAGQLRRWAGAAKSRTEAEGYRIAADTLDLHLIDLDALRVEVERLKADSETNGGLRDQLNTLTRERDALLAQVEGLTAERDGAVATATCVQRQYSAACNRRDVLQGERDAAAGESDQLRAQVERLRGFIESNMYDASGEAARRAREIVAETPTQSVAHIEAAALRAFADTFNGRISGYTVQELRGAADRIEQAAGS